MATVLLVEGDDQVRVLAESYLEEQGHEVLSAGTAPGALALLDKTSRVDLLITDVDLKEEIEQYAKDHDAFNAPFMEGSTFTTVLSTLKDERDLVFNEDNRKIIVNVDEHSNELDYLITKIEEQINHYGEIRMGLNIYFKGIN